ncbi:MAG: hypothetical protein ACE5O2_16580, partial [Armatimonadota bacterium]
QGEQTGLDPHWLVGRMPVDPRDVAGIEVDAELLIEALDLVEGVLGGRLQVGPVTAPQHDLKLGAHRAARHAQDERLTRGERERRGQSTGRNNGAELDDCGGTYVTTSCFFGSKRITFSSR